MVILHRGRGPGELMAQTLQQMKRKIRADHSMNSVVLPMAGL
jgi:hypothetical protein